MSARLLLVPLLCTCLTACAALQPPGGFVGMPANLAPLRYYDWARAASAAELAAERSRLDAAASNGDPLITSVQRALLLSVSAETTAARQRQALALLDSTAGIEAGRGRQRDYRAMADLLRESLARQAAAPASAPVPVATAPATDTQAEEEMEALRESNRQLQEKIDALTNIERQLIERELQTQP